MRAELEIPLQRTGIWIQGQQAACIEIVAGADAAIVVGSRIAGSPIERIQIRVVSAGHPGGPAAMQIRISRPTFIAFFAGPRDGPEAPFFFARFRVKGRQKSAHAVIATGNADHHLVFHDQRSAGCAIVLVAGRIGNLPKQVARPRVET
jgi:hypothetical protein